MWFMFVIPFVIFFIVFLMIAKSMFRSHKKTVERMRNMVKNASGDGDQEVVEVYIPVQSIQQNQAEASKPKEIVCDYCGERVSESKSECPSCGARLRKK